MGSLRVVTCRYVVVNYVEIIVREIECLERVRVPIQTQGFCPVHVLNTFGAGQRAVELTGGARDCGR